MAMMSNPDGSYGKVSPEIAKKKVVTLATQGVNTVANPNARTYENSLDSSSMAGQRILFEN